MKLKRKAGYSQQQLYRTDYISEDLLKPGATMAVGFQG